MKTIKEWLEMLNETERSEALANYDPEYCSCTNEIDSVEFALSEAFDWANSKEGWIYWADIFSCINKNTYKFNHENKQSERL